MPFGAVLVAGRREHHVGVVDVGAVFALGQPEGHHLSGLQVIGGLELGVLVLALPDRSETQDGDLLGVPVGQPVEPEDLGERGVARGVPALVRVGASVLGAPLVRGELRRSEERREQLLPLDELDEIRGPLRGKVIVQDALLALALEPVDGRAQQPPRFIVELLRVVGVRIEEQAVGLRHDASLGRGPTLGSRLRRLPAAAEPTADRGSSGTARWAPRWRLCASAAPPWSAAAPPWWEEVAAAPRTSRWRRRGLRDGHRGRRRLLSDGAGLGRLCLRRRSGGAAGGGAPRSWSASASWW